MFEFENIGLYLGFSAVIDKNILVNEFRVEKLFIVGLASEAGFVEFGFEQLVQVGKLIKTIAIETSKMQQSKYSILKRN